ncbi:Glycoside hydrolase, family 35 [Sesbania bispinosa]|nr:Glycoside hydrolase, family 35 [Sesbania bispinosa]
MKNLHSKIVFIALLSIIIPSAIAAKPKHDHGRVKNIHNVTYDGRSLFVNGRRELLFSGSIHYTRSTPDMWPDILERARHGGLNVIQTYVFWNAHEPEKGKFNFEGNNDLVKFIRLVQEKGMHCGDTFSGPNKPYKPSLWTENWTAQKALLAATSSVQKINEFHEVRVYEKPGTSICAAFITNNHSTEAATIGFRGSKYFLPPHSISVLPDCKTEVFNTQNIVSQHNSRSFVKSGVANNHKWEMFNEAIPSTKKLPTNQVLPAELYSLLKDKTDYAWYTTSFELGPDDMPKKSGVSPVIRIMSLGHSLQAFVNGKYIGSQHGTHEEKSFEFERPVDSFRVGMNYISILASTVGLPDSGAYMEHRYAGPKSITVLGLNTGTIDLTSNSWGHRVGLKGEGLQVFTEEGSKKIDWKPVNGVGRPVTWYKTRFTTPEGKGPVAIRMTGMAKGMIWVNGQSIGRHWMSFVSPLGQPTQSEYHIPRAYLNPEDNLLVILEEEKANPGQIEILNVDRDTVCSFVSENYPPNVNSWVAKGGQFLANGNTPKTEASVRCGFGKKIVAVEFASFGNPSGYCGKFVMGNCDAAATKKIVEQQCLGKDSCSVVLNRKVFNKSGGDACPGLMKTLAIQVKCSF